MDANRVPLAFRAQIEGRSQIQRIDPDLKREEAANNDAYIWAREWLRGASQRPPKFAAGVKTREYQITWRFLTNSGQDESIIRPVIGGTGCPFYPGSSMKGAFRRACQEKFRDRVFKYCGGEETVAGQLQTKPGILRFHGGYPVNDDWKTESIVDVVHPQQDWQVETQAGHGAFFMMSLFKPKLRFGISSNTTLSEAEWQDIWQIWETALGYGIGSRVSAGYGHVAESQMPKLLSIHLNGDGLISKRVNNEWEFRPNMFKATLRGHTLRLFGGVTTPDIANHLTQQLWGGFAGGDGSVVGELGIAFNYDRDDLHVYKGRVQPFELDRGKLDILLMKSPDKARQDLLRKFVVRLMKFSMMLGGFGKSWRRASHHKFFSDGNYNTDIGCHWEFLGSATKLYRPLRNLEDTRKYFRNLHRLTQDWVTQVEGQRLSAAGANWREAWHPDRVQVWARFDEDIDAISTALDWFHRDYANGRSIKRSHLTGKLGTVGRMWQRMYPWYVKTSDGKLKRKGFIEFVTIFPDLEARGRALETQRDFLRFLEQQSDFTRVW